MSKKLKKKGVPHNVLNAKHHKAEAEIVEDELLDNDDVRAQLTENLGSAIEAALPEGAPVSGELVDAAAATVLDDPAGDVGEPLDRPAEHEEGRPGVSLIEDVELPIDDAQVGDHQQLSGGGHAGGDGCHAAGLPLGGQRLDGAVLDHEVEGLAPGGGQRPPAGGR